MPLDREAGARVLTGYGDAGAPSRNHYDDRFVVPVLSAAQRLEGEV